MLDIVASYRRMQFQGKIIIQIQENGEIFHFRSDLGPFRLSQLLYIMVSYHHVKY